MCTCLSTSNFISSVTLLMISYFHLCVGSTSHYKTEKIYCLLAFSNDLMFFICFNGRRHFFNLILTRMIETERWVSTNSKLLICITKNEPCYIPVSIFLGSIHGHLLRMAHKLSAKKIKLSHWSTDHFLQKDLKNGLVSEKKKFP